MELSRPDLRNQLAYQFLQQERFTLGYSPLYRRLFAAFAGWLESPAPQPIADWLVEASADRSPFDVTLLLAAAIHRDVLAGESASEDLRRYYPTVGGTSPADEDRGFEEALRAAVLSRRDALSEFIGSSFVQTNETARGLAWLLPVALTGWPEIRLVELGASAGLNLVADRRAYRLVSETHPHQSLFDLGEGQPVQFQTRIIPGNTVKEPLPFEPNQLKIPNIVTRTGGDLSPFSLATTEDERTLASFVWADQPARLDRLQEGIAAARLVNSSTSAISLKPLRLPDQLPGFMDQVSEDRLDIPLVVFNTTMSMYLEGKAAALREAMVDWVKKRKELTKTPLLWLQWEPHSMDEPEPPRYGLLAWTADLWLDGRHDHWRLAWVHAHGTELLWEPGIIDFARKLSKS